MRIENKLYLCTRNQKRGVAQLASAPRSGRGGRKFESSHPDKQPKIWKQIFGCCLLEDINRWII